MKACHAFHVIVTESLKFEMGFPSVLPCFFVLYWSYTYVHAQKQERCWTLILLCCVLHFCFSLQLIQAEDVFICADCLSHHWVL